jgi:shikimate kinase
MAAGKSTVGQSLARRLGWMFIDLDQVIEQIERATVAEIFSRSGQAVFRQAETTALAETLKVRHENVVLAVGGGAFARRENQDLLREHFGFVLYLSAPLEELWTRASSTNQPVRPLVRDRQTFKTLFESRLPEFQKADVEVSTSLKGVEDVAGEIHAILMSRGII